MLKKFTVLFLFASLCVSQAFFFQAPTAAANAEMTELVAMLPDSDVAVMFDVERSLTVAAPEMLNNDQKKIENLKKLLASIENQIGFSPEEIRQMAFGMKFPLNGKVPGKFEDFLSESQFTAIIRTKNSNQTFFDTWTKRLDVIMAFKEEKAPAQKYMEAFRAMRDRKIIQLPEYIAELTKGFQDVLTENQNIGKTLAALPKTPANRATIDSLIRQNRETETALNRYLKILKTDINTDAFREDSLKLLNRFNNVTLDDPQRQVKLNTILKESQALHLKYWARHKDLRKFERLFEPDWLGESGAKRYVYIGGELSKVSEILGSLPTAPLKRKEQLAAAGEVYGALKEDDDRHLKTVETGEQPKAEEETAMSGETPVPTESAEDSLAQYSPEKMNAPAEKPLATPVSLSETFKLAQKEVTINNKKMLVIDFNKFDEPEKPAAAATKSETDSTASATPPTEKKPDMPNFGIGFLDDRTMVIGLETGVTQFLQRDANYKNEKAVEMLASSKNPLMAFAVNSNIAKAINAAGVLGAAPAPVSAADSIFTKLFSDVNVYGSVNYDGGNVTNDVTMSLGMFKDQTGALISTPAATENNSDAADKTFQFGDSVISNSIFYDLLNSFKAVQASLTFKFDKKKVARLVRQTPRIIDGMMSKKDTKETENKSSKISDKKTHKLDTIEDLLTAPEVYLNLARLFSERES